MLEKTANIEIVLLKWLGWRNFEKIVWNQLSKNQGIDWKAFGQRLKKLKFKEVWKKTLLFKTSQVKVCGIIFNISLAEQLT